MIQIPPLSLQGKALEFQIQELNSQSIFFFFFLNLQQEGFFCVSFFAFSRAALVAYGGSQARSPVGAVVTGLCHSHSNSGSEPRLRPTSQLTATLDP